MKKVFLALALSLSSAVAIADSPWQRHLESLEQGERASGAKKELARKSVALLMGQVPMKIDPLHSLIDAQAYGEKVHLVFKVDALSYSEFEKPNKGPEKAFLDAYRDEAVKGLESQYCAGELIAYYPKVGMSVDFKVLSSDDIELVKLALKPNDCHRIIERLEKDFAQGSTAPSQYPIPEVL